MGELFNKLPYKKELETWIQTYGEYDYVNRDRYPASLEYLMRFWEEAKNEYLYKMFNGQFIIEQDFTFEKNRSELEDEMCQMINHNTFRQNYCDWVRTFAGNDFNLRYALRDLIHYSALTSNEYEGDTFSISIDSNRITIQRGCKPSRILGKIAKIANIEGYEEFRLAQSRIFNNRFSKGRLCLSIHPLDYLTMSDNDYDWESCMNWRNKGCYHLGTVEMMNSPVVVVAYLKGSKEMPFGRNCKWNNKKWRNLFIVTKDIITGIKGYPYQSVEFDKACIKALQTLAEKNLGYNYNNFILEHSFCDAEEAAYFEDINEDINFDFSTDYMYNDFGNDNTTHFVLGLNHPSDISCHYSGYPECMCCGAVMDESSFDEPDTVLCPACSGYTYCDHCGERISGEDVYELDGNVMCEECYLDCREYDPVDGEYHMRDNMEEITIIDDSGKLTSGTEKDIQEYITNSKTFFTYSAEKLPIKTYTYQRTTHFLWGFEDYHYTATCNYVLKSDISEDLWSEIMYH